MALLNVFKVTWFFQGRTRGWTESLWFQAGSADYVQMTAFAKKLATARAGCLAQPCFIKAYRVSLEGTGPDALLTYDNIPAAILTTEQGQNLDNFANDPDSSLLVRMSIASFARWKFLFLRGHPDRIFTRNGTYTPDPAWKAAFKQFAALIVRDPWGWIGVDPAAKVAKVPVIAAATDAITGVTTFTFGANVFPVGTDPTKLVRVRIAGVNGGHSPANNVWVGYPLTQTTFKTYKAAAVGIFRTPGIVSYTPLTFFLIKDVEDQKYAERKAGAPLLESRGRQPVRARG